MPSHKKRRDKKKIKARSYNTFSVLTTVLFLFLLLASGVVYHIRHQVLGAATTANSTVANLADIKFIDTKALITTKSSSSPFSHAAIQSTVNLNEWDPPVSLQQSDLCEPWSAGYLRDWYAKRDGYYPVGGFDPMFIYNHVSNPIWVTMSDILNVLVSQGVAPSLANSQGNASFYKIKGWSLLYKKGDVGSAQTKIEQALSSGNPVIIGMNVDRNFQYYQYSASNPEISSIDLNNTLGGHLMFVPAYNPQGVTIENSWGTNWGNNGFAQIAWSVINSNSGITVYSIDPINPLSSLKPLPTPYLNGGRYGSPTNTYGSCTTGITNNEAGICVGGSYYFGHQLGKLSNLPSSECAAEVIKLDKSVPSDINSYYCCINTQYNAVGHYTKIPSTTYSCVNGPFRGVCTNDPNCGVVNHTNGVGTVPVTQCENQAVKGNAPFGSTVVCAAAKAIPTPAPKKVTCASVGGFCRTGSAVSCQHSGCDVNTCQKTGLCGTGQYCCN